MDFREASKLANDFLDSWGDTWAVHGVGELVPGQTDECFVVIYHKETGLQSTLSPNFQPSIEMLTSGKSQL